MTADRAEFDRARAIADLIHEHAGGTEAGHCIRVEFLDRETALAVSAIVNDAHSHNGVATRAYVLRASQNASSPQSQLELGADEAIERRNRKTERLCLFVPSDVVDAAASSLGNSFAPLDGRVLLRGALDRLLASVPDDLATTVRASFGRLRGQQLRASDSARLDFLEDALERYRRGEAHLIGLALWRIGLLPDAGEDFLDRLEPNGRAVLALSGPDRPQASLRERVDSLGVDVNTQAGLLRTLNGRALHDVRDWARALAETELTYDRWVFPLQDRSDLRSVTVKPFVDVTGVVRRGTGLKQPDGPTGSLVAEVGKGKKLTVGWVSDPPRPSNISRWRVEIAPVSGEFDDATAVLPAREVTGDKDSARLSLDLDLEAEELPNTAVWVRVVPLDASGADVLDAQDQSIMGTSDEFYLKEGGAEDSPTGRLKTVPTIAFGRLQALVDGAPTLEESRPQILQRGGWEYFSLQLTDRVTVRVALAAPLRELQSLVLGSPRDGGRFKLDCDDASLAGIETFVPVAPPPGEREKWGAFWNARERFFQRLRAAEGRNAIETAQWTPELANAAVRYAQAYRELVDALANQGDGRTADLVDALSLDTVLVRTAGAGDVPDSALLVLPTHPLRVAWYANYTQLLGQWETPLAELNKPARAQTVDLDLLAEVAPFNAPPFAYWPGEPRPFVFFQNLSFFHGVALPVDVPDPHRRFSEVAQVLGVGDDSSSGDFRPRRLANHLREYQKVHPYVRRLELSVVNPDRGDLLADTLTEFLRPETLSVVPDEGADRWTSTFDIHAYAIAGHQIPLHGLDRVRQVQAEDIQVEESDPFVPMIAATVSDLATLSNMPPAEAHVVISSDLSQPQLSMARQESLADPAGSFSLHGLIARFVSTFAAEGDALRWRHRLQLDSSVRSEPHPAGARFGEALLDLHEALLHAGGGVCGGEPGTVPALEILVSADGRRLLDMLHARSDWVIAVDRFFDPDYYDTPLEPHVAEIARRHLLDYTPEFSDGVGHRVVVTTAWQDEVLRRIRRSLPRLGLHASSAETALDHLKTVSGRLAMRALVAEPEDAQTAALASVIGWLRARGRLTQAVLVPIDLHAQLLGETGTQLDRPVAEYCDLVLFALRRNIVEATFIAVRWRRGDADLDELAYEMLLPMERTERVVRSRFFEEERVDGALQRARLSSALRFYVDRSHRHGVIEPVAEALFREHLARLEKTGLDFRPAFEGYIVSDAPTDQKRFTVGDTNFTVLTTDDLDSGTGFAKASASAGTRPFQPSLELPPAPRPPLIDGERPVSPQPEPASADGIEHIPEANGELDEAVGPEQDKGSEAETAETGGEPTVLLGHTAAGGQDVAWRPSVKGSPHLFVLGIPGQGKSWTVARVVAELSRQGVPALILDFHGQFTEQGGLAGARQPNVLDAREGLPFSPFEVGDAAVGANDWQTNAFNIAEIFGYVAKLGDMQRDVVYTAIRDAYRANGFDAANSNGLAEYPTLEEVQSRIEHAEKAGRAANVAARCRPLLEFHLFRPPAGRGTDLLSIIREGLVIDLHRLADLEVLQLAAGAFVLRKLYKDMFSWGEAPRLRLAVVLDEAHRLSRDVTLPKIMKEGRKFGIAVVVASQGMADFHVDVLGNAGTKVIFRMNHPDSRKVTGFIRAPQGVDLAQRIEQLGVGQAYVQTPDMRLGTIVRMEPPSGVSV